MTTEPLLESQASRDFMRRYAATSTDVHEIAADAIHLAENRGVMAALAALGAMTTDIPGELIIPTGRFLGGEVQQRIDRELGRTP